MKGFGYLAVQKLGPSEYVESVSILCSYINTTCRCSSLSAIKAFHSNILQYWSHHLTERVDPPHWRQLREEGLLARIFLKHSTTLRDQT